MTTWTAGRIAHERQAGFAAGAKALAAADAVAADLRASLAGQALVIDQLRAELAAANRKTELAATRRRTAAEKVAEMRGVIAVLRKAIATAKARVVYAVKWQTGSPPPMTRLVCVVADRLAVCTYRTTQRGGQWFDEKGLPVTVERWAEVWP